MRTTNDITGDLEMSERNTMIKQNMYSNFIVSRMSWREGVRTFAFSTSMSCRGIKKSRTKNKAKKGKTGKDKHLELSTASN